MPGEPGSLVGTTTVHVRELARVTLLDSTWVSLASAVFAGSSQSDLSDDERGIVRSWPSPSGQL